MKPPYVVLTDLDGTLLDARTYEWTPARPALARLEALGVPVVLCSSKTRSEVETVRPALARGHPFIVENGGGVFIPRGYFPSPHPITREEGSYEVIEFGARHSHLLAAVGEIRRETGLPIRGFSDMTAGEVAFFTGLREDEAARAKERDYDEPLLAALAPEDEDRLRAAAERRGLTLSRGGRFYHLHGGHSKGEAAAYLARCYRAEWPGVRTIGLGDGPNDLPLLLAVDLPIVIPRELGVVDPVFLHRNWPVAALPGPAGWNLEILRLLDQGNGAGAAGAADAAPAGPRGSA